jgi:glycosyltransferase involved in cell wall biosynthesis
MNILRKFKTAKAVLKNHGLKEAGNLVIDNVSAFFKWIVMTVNKKVFRAAKRNRFIRTNKKNVSKLHILYISSGYEAENGQTVRYRVYNLIEALRGRAETIFELIESDFQKNDSLIRAADIIVLSRVDWSKKSEAVINTAKRFSVPIVFDIDDIIFMPAFVDNYCRVLGDTSEKNKKMRLYDFEKFEKVFLKCDYSTASTNYITDLMQQNGKSAFVIHNSLNNKQLRIAKNAANNTKKSNELYISYLSGTKTHDLDFKQVIPALTRIVKEYDNVKLSIVGYLNINDLPAQLKAKTETLSYMRWERLLKHSAQNYINLAPLDVDNPFCHAKSELKYFEAAIVGVPTIASPTDTFKRCLTHRLNGMLASNEDEWYSALKALIEDKNLYENVKKNALEHVMARYIPSAIADEAMKAYEQILTQYKKKK